MLHKAFFSSSINKNLEIFMTNDEQRFVVQLPPKFVDGILLGLFNRPCVSIGSKSFGKTPFTANEMCTTISDNWKLKFEPGLTIVHWPFSAQYPHNVYLKSVKIARI